MSFFASVQDPRIVVPIILAEDRELEPTLGDFKCRPCGQRFGSRRGLRLHQKKFHRSYGCENCSETFDLIKELEKHQTESGHGPHSPASSGLQNQRYCHLLSGFYYMTRSFYRHTSFI